MAKFDFNNSRYAKFFGSAANRKFLQTFVNTDGILHTNYGWWKTQFKKADLVTPTTAQGVASFTVKAIDRTAAPLMDMRAPLGGSNPMDAEGIGWYTATIPDFIARGIQETAPERKVKEDYFEDFGEDKDIVEAWTQKIQTQVDSANATLTFMGAQLQSKGLTDYSNIGMGIQAPLHKADIPTANFKNAGEKVWNAEDCNILEQMKKIESDFRDAKGYNGAMKWMLPRDMFNNVFLKNKFVIEWVKYSADVNNNQKLPDTVTITEQMWANAIQYPGVSPIEVVVEKARNLTFTADTFVNGWEANTAVLRPVGLAGEIQYTDILDKKMFDRYGSSAVSKVWATIEQGLFTLVNTTLNNGELKEWHTDLMMSCVPSLTEFPYHVIVNTQSAG